MNRTTLQIPMSIDLRKQAEKQALEQGFSSLQEAVRLFLNKLARGSIGISFEKSVQLSQKAIKRYNKIDEDIKKGKNIYHAKDVDDLMRQLRGNNLS